MNKKVSYSLKDFHAEVARISGKPARLVAVAVEFGLFGKVEFKCYADGYKQWFIAGTPEEALHLLSQSKHHRRRC